MKLSRLMGKKTRKRASKVKNVKVALKQVKQKAAGFGSWLSKELMLDTNDLAYTQAHTHGFGIVGLEMGM